MKKKQLQLLLFKYTNCRLLKFLKLLPVAVLGVLMVGSAALAQRASDDNGSRPNMTETRPISATTTLNPYMPASSTGFIENFDDDPCGGSQCTSFERTLGGVVFEFIFTNDGTGGDFIWQDQFGLENSASIDARSGSFDEGQTERFIIKRQDDEKFTFNSIYLWNFNGGDVTVRGYLSGVGVGPEHVIGQSGDGAVYDFEGITVDEIRFTSNDFYNFSFDAFSGDSAPNMPPTAADFSRTGTKNSAHSFGSAFADVFDDPDGDDLTHITITSAPSNGTLRINSTPIGTPPQQVSAAQLPDFNYLPDTDQFGFDFDSFEYTVNDGEEDSESSYTVTMHINDDVERHFSFSSRDGSGSRGAEIPGDGTPFDFENPFTIEFWINPEEFSADRASVFSTRATNAEGSFQIDVGGTGDGLSGRGRVVVTGQNNWTAVTEANVVEENEWAHVAYVKWGNTADDQAIYVNGILQDLPSSTDFTIQNNTDDIQIFRGTNLSSNQQFTGNISDLRIWSRDLSESEIRARMFKNFLGNENDLEGIYFSDKTGGGEPEAASPISPDAVLTGEVQWDGDRTRPHGVILDGGEGFRMLSAAVEANLADLLAPIWTQGATGADISHGNPNVFVWDVEEDEWAAVTDLTTTEVSAGTGILVYVFDKDDFDDEESNVWPKTLSVSGEENAADASPDVNQDENGFTLLGNPFASTISFDGLTTDDLTGTIYVWDANDGSGDGGGDTGPNDPGAGSWKSWTGSAGEITDGLIAPFQGFFVQSGPGSPSVTFPEDARTAGGELLGKQNEEERMIVRLEMNGQNMRNSAWLSFSEDGSLESQVHGDALKLEPLSDHFALLGTQKDDGTLFDISHLPVMEDEYSVPVHISASQNGSYTLTATDLELPNGFELYFHDHTAGTSVQIDQNFEYTVEVASAAKANEQLSAMERVKQGPVVAKATEEALYSISVVSQQGVNIDEPGTRPERVALNQNYPNPFNPVTVISYELPVNGEVTLDVFDMTGRKVATLVNGQMNAGSHNVTFDASSLSSGVYIYRLQTQGMTLTRKLTLIK